MTRFAYISCYSHTFVECYREFIALGIPLRARNSRSSVVLVHQLRLILY